MGQETLYTEEQFRQIHPLIGDCLMSFQNLPEGKPPANDWDPQKRQRIIYSAELVKRLKEMRNHDNHRNQTGD